MMGNYYLMPYLLTVFVSLPEKMTKKILTIISLISSFTAILLFLEHLMMNRHLKDSFEQQLDDDDVM